ncbi:MAG: o-succinylbenzoate--CoA ligase [Pseudonocardiaceae bacterium]
MIPCDGSPAAVAELRGALAAVLDGRAALAPLGPGDTAPSSGVEPGHVVVTTSGSSGEPKRVLLTAAALRASATATYERLGGAGSWLLALPAHHVAGIQVLVRSALAGTAPGVLDLRGGFDPAAFAAATAALPGTRRYTSLVPTQLLRLLDVCPGALTAFDAVLLGGAAAAPALVARARAAGVAVVTTYGMSETCGGCVYDGLPLDGVQVRLDAAGRIELAGPVLADGYLGRPDDPAFRDGWFRTADLGALAADGRLQVLGRVDDVIITAGVNVAPAVVEAALAVDPAVAAVCVVGIPDPQWGQRVIAAVVPADAGHPLDTDAVLAEARRRLDGAHTPKQVVVMSSLPLRGVGKPDRRAVAELVRRALG